MPNAKRQMPNAKRLNEVAKVAEFRAFRFGFGLQSFGHRIFSIWHLAFGHGERRRTRSRAPKCHNLK
jgi:hypothetical protein